MPVALLPADIKRLQSIQSFDSLVNYLRDDLDWPLDEIDIEDLTFDYSPEELGLQQQYVVKLKSIKQLRPLVTHQPWGIFYLEFERKKLPVVVLRRILKELVPKKRASANQAERALWHKQDLLFISSQGEDAHRRLSFAHFCDLPDGRTGLDTFDWDDRETQFAGIGLALDKLHWPNNVSDVEAWRKGWASAFTRPHGYVVQTAEQLSRALAELAGRTRTKVEDIYRVERTDGPLHKLFEAFKAALVHDLTPSRFADMVAQTVAYGLFAARAERDDTLRLSHLAEMIPATNPFLRELFGEIEALADDPESYLSFDELGVSDIVALLNAKNITAIVEDFGRQTGGGREDPVIHFYESFLKDYDADQRVQRGVFYTPQPVVSFIIRSVDRILRQEFGLEDGLADTTTWGEMQVRFPNLTLPKGVSPDAPFVQILDPATGTGTFLVEVIDVIWRTMTAKWEKAGKKSQIHALWNEYVPKHLLPRVNGFELMMASYAIAHVKLGLKLRQTGYEFGSGERLRVFLTNTLEEPDELGAQKTMATAFNFLAHESWAADAVKRDTPVTVIVGNPPYSKMSSNLGSYAVKLIEPFRFVDGQRIVERGALALELNLQDDYVKFFAFMMRKLSSVGLHVGGYISNFRFLSSSSLRGMRSLMMESASNLTFLNLGGHIAERGNLNVADDNVFDIEQGVAISLIRRTGLGECAVEYHRMFGTMDSKFDRLLDDQLDRINYVKLAPQKPLYKFISGDNALSKEFYSFPSLAGIFPINSGSIITSRDNLTIDFDKAMLLEKVRRFAYSSEYDASILEEIGFSVKTKWDVEACKRKLREEGVPDHYVREILYRPFDIRYIYYFLPLIDTPSRPVSSMLNSGDNLVLLSPKVTTTTDFTHIFIRYSVK